MSGVRAGLIAMGTWKRAWRNALFLESKSRGHASGVFVFYLGVSYQTIGASERMNERTLRWSSGSAALWTMAAPTSTTAFRPLADFEKKIIEKSYDALAAQFWYF